MKFKKNNHETFFWHKRWEQKKTFMGENLVVALHVIWEKNLVVR